MHDAEGVRLREAFGSLHDVAHGMLRSRARPRAGRRSCCTADLRVQVMTVEELHHDVRSAVLEATDVEGLRDVRPLEPYRRASLTQEAIDEIVVRGRLLEQELQRDLLRELDVLGGHHDAHAADAEDLLDPIFRRQDVALFDGRGGAGRDGRRGHG